MADLTPAGITSGDANDESVVHASDADVGDLSRSHKERDISRLQSSVLDYDPTKTYEVGDIVKNPDIFTTKCITQITVPEAYDSSKWDLISPGIFVMGLDTDKKGNTVNLYAGMFTNKADFATELPSQMFLNFPWLLVNIALHIGLNAVGAGGTDFVFRKNGSDVLSTLINVPTGVTGSFSILGANESFASGDLFNVRWIQIGGGGDVDNWSWNCEATTEA